MIKKMYIRCCPIPGCAKISLKQGTRCPTHDKLMKREKFIHESEAMPEFMSGIGKQWPFKP